MFFPIIHGLQFRTRKPRALKPLHRLTACWPALLLLGLPFFFVGGPGFHSPRSFARAWDFGHVLYFGLFTLWLGKSRFARRFRPVPRLLLLLALPFLTGYLIEWLQFLANGRSPTFDDMIRNLLGAAFALCFLLRPGFQAGFRKTLFTLARGLVLLCFLAALHPTIAALWDEFQARRQFPVLAGFESRYELSRWYHPGQLKLERQVVRHGAGAALVRLSTAKYSGVTLHHFPHDWRGYRFLRFSAYNPLAEPLELHCRLDDESHRRAPGRPYADRFNARFDLQPGWNDLEISLEEAEAAPKGRRMDMANIVGFGLFVVEQKEPIAIRLDDVRLE